MFIILRTSSHAHADISSSDLLSLRDCIVLLEELPEDGDLRGVGGGGDNRSKVDGLNTDALEILRFEFIIDSDFESSFLSSIEM